MKSTVCNPYKSVHAVFGRISLKDCILKTPSVI